MESRERPMLYSTDMVVSILQDRKMKTRRMTGLEDINQTPDAWTLVEMGLRQTLKGDTVTAACFESSGAMGWVDCPYGQPGDMLWVRESFSPVLDHWDENGFFVAADKVIFKADFKEPVAWNWKPSIHMKKIHARIWLQITDIRVERLQSISDSDAISEGITSKTERKKSGLCIFYKDYCNRNDWYWSAKASFMSLWQKINGRESWRSNPWVWVISFKVLSKTGKPSTIPSGFESQERLKSSPSGNVQEQVEEAHLLPGNGEKSSTSHFKTNPYANTEN